MAAMKTVIGISLGAKSQDFDFRTRFLGADLRVRRLGTDGNVAQAGRLLRQWDAKADAIGLVGALASTRLFQSLLFGVGERDPFTFATVIALLAAVAVAACVVPALRAADVDPIVALRQE